MEYFETVRVLDSYASCEARGWFLEGYSFIPFDFRRYKALFIPYTQSH